MLINPLGEHHLLQHLCPTVPEESWTSEKLSDEGRIQLPHKKEGKLTEQTQLLKQELMSETSDIPFIPSANGR